MAMTGSTFIRCCAPQFQTMPEADYQAELDTIWRKLRPYLEWTEGFALAVLFARHPAPVQALRTRLQEMLSMNTLPLRQFVLEQPEQLDATLIGVLTSRPLSGKHPPLWLEMWRDVGSEEVRAEQRRAVWQVLSRLNERRFLLERDVACPLVLVLPAELRMDIPSMAPDLWSVRAITADLPVPAVVARQPRVETEYALPKLAQSCEVSAAEIEWRRLWQATEDKQRLSAEAAFAAIDAALERVDYDAARGMVGEILPLLREGDNAELGILRRRSIALNYSGNVDFGLGRLEEAGTAYAESLELSRRLREVVGDAPQTLRDLSVSLENVGGVEQALGRLEEAGTAYAESLELRRRLREVVGDAPQTLRDLSVSLNNVGGVEQALGRLDEAGTAYAESREIIAQLAKAFPDVPQYQKDLAYIEARIAAMS